MTTKTRTYTRLFNCETMRLTIETNMRIPEIPFNVWSSVARLAGKSYTLPNGNEAFEFITNSEFAFERAEKTLLGALFVPADGDA